MTENEVDASDTKPGQPAQANPWKRYLVFVALSFIALYMLSARTLEFLTVPLDRQVIHFEFAYHVEYLLLLGFSALVVGSLYFALHLVLSARHPRAWQALVGVGAGFVFGAVVVHRAALNLTDWIGNDEFVWVFQHQSWFAYATAGLFGLIPPVRKRTLRASLIGAKLLAPLPVVMAIYFAGVPQYHTRYDDLPEAQQSEQPPAPVLLLVFDALDKKSLFEDPEALERLPSFRRCVEDFTYFPNGRTSAFHTAESMPAMLYQKQVSREEYESAINEGAQPWKDDTSFFELIGREGDVRVVSGYYVMYDAVIGDRVNCIRSRTLSYPKHVGPWWRIRSQVRMIAGNNYVPGFSENVEDMLYWDPYMVKVGEESQSDVLDSIRLYRGNLVGVFHLPWPHPPFIWNRQGPTDGDTSYLDNAEWADANLQEILDALKSEGLYENATIIITGDHGMPLASPNHPPLMIKLPGQTKGRTIDAVTYNNRVVEWLRKQPEFNRLRPPEAP